MKDDFYLRHMVKFNILQPIFKLLSKNGSKDNLIVSSIIELVEFIRLEKINSLVTYIVEKHASAFENLTHECFELLQKQYDQHLEYLNDLKNGIVSGAEGDGTNDKKKSVDARTQKLNDMEMEESYLLDDDEPSDENERNHDINSDDMYHPHGYVPLPPPALTGYELSSLWHLSSAGTLAMLRNLDDVQSDEPELPPRIMRLGPHGENGDDDDESFFSSKLMFNKTKKPSRVSIGGALSNPLAHGIADSESSSSSSSGGVASSRGVSSGGGADDSAGSGEDTISYFADSQLSSSSSTDRRKSTGISFQMKKRKAL